MDAMKIITEGMIKEDRPEFNVGDTVRVSVRIKEGERERLKALSSRRSTAVLPRPLLCAALLTAWASSVCSP